MRRRGFSLIELLIVVAIVIVLATLALGPYNNAKQSANEASALNSIKALHTAEQQHLSDTGRFAPSLEQLASLVSADLASGEMSGYRFTVSGNGTEYTFLAIPLKCGSTGRKSLYSDQTMNVREASCPEVPTAQSPVFKR